MPQEGQPPPQRTQRTAPESGGDPFHEGEDHQEDGGRRRAPLQGPHDEIDGRQGLESGIASDECKTQNASQYHGSRDPRQRPGRKPSAGLEEHLDGHTPPEALVQVEQQAQRADPAAEHGSEEYGQEHEDASSECERSGDRSRGDHDFGRRKGIRERDGAEKPRRGRRTHEPAKLASHTQYQQRQESRRGQASRPRPPRPSSEGLHGPPPFRSAVGTMRIALGSARQALSQSPQPMHASSTMTGLSMESNRIA